MRTEIAELERGFSTETLFDGAAPLLDVLRRRVWFEGGETDGRSTQHRRREVKVTRNDDRGRNEVVALLCFRKHVRHVVTLITPRVHIDGREEDAKARRKPQLVRVVHYRRRETIGRDRRNHQAIQNRGQLWISWLDDQFAVSNVARKHSRRAARQAGAALGPRAAFGRNRARRRPDLDLERAFAINIRAEELEESVH